MKKILFLLIFIIMFASFIYADRTQYYYDGTYYISDGTETVGHQALNGVNVTNTLTINNGGWTMESGTPFYSTDKNYTGNFSIKLANGDIHSYNVADNATFDGVIVWYVWHTTNTPYTNLFFMGDDRFGLYSAISTANWMYMEDGGVQQTCDLNTITPASTANKWVQVMLNYTKGVNITGYVNGIPCHKWTGEGGIDNLRWVTETNEADYFYMDNIYMLGDESAPSAQANFVPPTPADTVHNNTNVIFNMTCSSGNLTFWFQNSTNPTQIRINNANLTKGYINWSTSSLTLNQTTYYYKASCDKGLTNTTIRSWIYDSVPPALTINNNNFFNYNNGTNYSNYANELPINLTVTDNVGVYAFEINISKTLTNTEVYYYANSSINNVSFNFNKLIPSSNWTSGGYTIDVWYSDIHTTEIIKDYTVIKKSNELQFKTDEGNDIKISTNSSSTTDTKKLTDRYDFQFTFNDKTTSTKTFFLTSDNKIDYLKDSKYKAHFVIYNNKKGNWIDFEGVDNKYEVKKISDKEYMITFFDMTDSITFNSVGGLNVVNTKFYWYKGTYIALNATGTSTENILLSVNITYNNISITKLTPTSSVITTNLIYDNVVYPVSVVNYTGYKIFNTSLAPLYFPTARYINYTWNVTVNTYDYNYTFNISGSHYVTNTKLLFNLVDEKNLTPFDISSANSVKMIINCPNNTITETITNSTFNSTTNCNFNKIKFVVDYGSLGTYYRTVLMTLDTSYNSTIYLMNLLNTTALFNSFVLDDLLSEYGNNPRMYIKKNIDDEKKVILSDYFDAEKKVSAYLIQYNEYYIYLAGDSKSETLIGTYSADASGTKNLQLYNLDLTPSTPVAVTTCVTAYPGYINNGYLTARFYDICGVSTNIVWRIYNDTTLVASYSIPTYDTMVTYPTLMSDYWTNTTKITVNISFTFQGVEHYAYTIVQTGMLKNTSNTPFLGIMPQAKQSTINWIVFIICTVIALGFTRSTALIGGIVMYTLLAILMVFEILTVNWMLIGMGIMLGVILILRKGGDKSPYSDN